MTPEVMERIFEPFFTTKGPQQGSGLGLSMVYGVIQQQSGLIDVSSQPGGGTSFHLYLPEAEQPVKSADTAHEDSEKPKGERGTILVAEDELQLRLLTERILETNGFSTISAQDGEEAVRLFESAKQDIKLVLLDLIMPKMGGRKAYDRIRAISSDVPVIFQTGHNPEASDSEFLTQQRLPLLRKPYSMRSLMAIVDKLLLDSAHGSG